MNTRISLTSLRACLYAFMNVYKELTMMISIDSYEGVIV
jgi:hypothetical protein